MLSVVAGLIQERGKILIAQRNATGPHPLKWEFPGGKVEAGETPESALRRELEEELGIEAQIGPEFSHYEFTYAGTNPILLTFFEVSGYSGLPENRGAFAQILWDTPANLNQYDFLEGDLPLIQLFGKVHVDQVD